MRQIPLRASLVNANQEFSVTLGDHDFAFRLTYISSTGRGTWACDISIDGEQAVSGAMLEPNASLLRHYSDSTVGDLLFVGAEPTLDNLGQSNALVWVPADG